MSRTLFCVPLLLAAGVALAADAPEPGRVEDATTVQPAPEEKTERVEGADGTPAKKQDGPKEISGMSILGNREAPKSLVIVPWKSSVLGDTLGISPILDESRQPVDREVFMRALSYYEVQHAAAGASAGVDEETDPN